MLMTEAVKKAKSSLLELLEDEEPTNIGLEEIIYDQEKGVWRVTIGFSRPWNSIRNAYTAISGEPAAKRAYRVFEIDNHSGNMISMSRRSFED